LLQRINIPCGTSNTYGTLAFNFGERQYGQTFRIPEHLELDSEHTSLLHSCRLHKSVKGFCPVYFVETLYQNSPDK
jgi:hypothetical protein